jgi:N-dimethylarginine dimethylaminohydrolase
VGPVQHLLGALTFAAPDLATVHPRSASPELREALASRGIRALVLDDDDELRVRRGNNFVATAPGHVLLPAGCPGIRRRLAAAGVESTEVRVDQSLAAGGGIGCLTAILHRSSEGEPS